MPKVLRKQKRLLNLSALCRNPSPELRRGASLLVSTSSSSSTQPLRQVSDEDIVQGDAEPVDSSRPKMSPKILIEKTPPRSSSCRHAQLSLSLHVEPASPCFFIEDEREDDVPSPLNWKRVAFTRRNGHPRLLPVNFSPYTLQRSPRRLDRLADKLDKLDLTP